MINKLFSQSGRRWLFFMAYEKFIRALPYPNLRTYFLRLGGASIGENSFIHDITFMNVYSNGFKNLSIGDKTTIQTGCIIDLADKVTLGNEVTIGPGVSIFTHEDCGVKMGKPLGKYFPRKVGGVSISNGAWIGANATILHGVNIGPCSLVSACSLVNKNVPSWSVVGGIPAEFKRLIK